MSGHDFPKLSLIKDRQASGLASLAIRFNAASLSDDDDDDGGIVLPTSSPNESPLTKLPTEPGGSSRTMDSDKSLLNEIKGHLPDQVSAMIDRNLETDKASDKENKLKKRNSQDSMKAGELETSEQESAQCGNVDISDVFLPTTPLLIPLNVCVTEDLIDDEVGKSPLDSIGGKLIRPSSSLIRLRTNIADGKEGSAPSSPLRRFISMSNEKDSLPSSSVTMSTLLSKDEEEMPRKVSEEEFFDPKEPTITKDLTDAPASHTELFLPQRSSFQSIRSELLMHFSGSMFTIVASVVLACLLVPLSPYISGLALGIVIGAMGLHILQWLTEPSLRKPELQLEPLDEMPPFQVPEMRESRNEPGKFKGWLNELTYYEPDDYHISSTRTVFVQLEGTRLRLQTPKQPVAKRAMWNEPDPHKSVFVHQRFVELGTSKVFLLPTRLVKKRLWSKKYPICIELNFPPADTKHTPIDNFKLAGEKEKTDMETEHIAAQELDYEVIPQGNKDGKMLYLFARTSREKEEWYRRFYSASQRSPLPSQMVSLMEKLYEERSRHVSVSSEKEVRSSLLNAGGGGGGGGHSNDHSVTSLPHSATDTNLPSVAVAAAAASSGPLSPPASPQCSTSLPAISSVPDIIDPSKVLYMQYLRYMARIMPTDSLDRFLASAGPNLSPRVFSFEKVIAAAHTKKCDENLVWFNSLLGRVFWDFLREKYWADIVKEKIQRKLSKIHVPFFIDELTVTGIDLGNEFPLIRRITRPYIDDRGLWFDLDIAYSGGFSMSLETKINLMKLKRTNSELLKGTEENLMSPDCVSISSDIRNPATNSEEEDSAESSTDEELEDTVQDSTAFDLDPNRDPETMSLYRTPRIHTPRIRQKKTGHSTSTNTSKKLLRLVDKIAANRYFQQATEYKYIKKAMEEVSNTRLMLKVELKSLVGVLAVNIPAPPTDRIWYGFRTNPSLYLSAKPQVGERTISVSHITDWIEKKLAIEFQRVLVFPNMDDLHIPLMCDVQAGAGSGSDSEKSSFTATSTAPTPQPSTLTPHSVYKDPQSQHRHVEPPAETTSQ